jgi:hypothetical protein
MKAKRTGRPRRSEPARKFGLTLRESEHALLVAHGPFASCLSIDEGEGR